MRTIVELSPDDRRPVAEEGYSLWVEDGVWFTAPTVDPKLFGCHDYDEGGFLRGVRDCCCGCDMQSSSSGGPVDPYGACPMNPKDSSWV